MRVFVPLPMHLSYFLTGCFGCLPANMFRDNCNHTFSRTHLGGRWLFGRWEGPIPCGKHTNDKRSNLAFREGHPMYEIPRAASPGSKPVGGDENLSSQNSSETCTNSTHAQVDFMRYVPTTALLPSQFQESHRHCPNSVQTKSCTSMLCARTLHALMPTSSGRLAAKRVAPKSRRASRGLHGSAFESKRNPWSATLRLRSIQAEHSGFRDAAG